MVWSIAPWRIAGAGRCIWNTRRISETGKIADYMKSIGMDISWWENVKTGKQDPWDKLRTNDINKQMVQFNVRTL